MDPPSVLTMACILSQSAYVLFQEENTRDYDIMEQNRTEYNKTEQNRTKTE